jgi:predicted kinase
MVDLICIGGLPGVGKTSVAKALQEVRPNSVLLDPDVIRLEILGKNPNSDFLTEKDITSETTSETIKVMKQKAEQYLKQGVTVIIGSAFLLSAMRIEYEQIASNGKIKFRPVWLEADIEARVERGQKRLNGSGGVSAVSEEWIRQIQVDGDIAWPVVDASGTLNDVVSAVELSLRG